MSPHCAARTGREDPQPSGRREALLAAGAVLLACRSAQAEEVRPIKTKGELKPQNNKAKSEEPAASPDGGGLRCCWRLVLCMWLQRQHLLQTQQHCGCSGGCQLGCTAHVAAGALCTLGGAASSRHRADRFRRAGFHTLYGKAGPPTSYGGYGGNAREAAK